MTRVCYNVSERIVYCKCFIIEEIVYAESMYDILINFNY